MSSYYFVVFFPLLLMITSCGKEDGVDPIINDATINNSTDTLVLSPGENFQIKAQLSDETELQQYLVLIQSDFDRESTKSNTTVFEQTRIQLISGKSWSLDESFQLHDSVSSGYYYGLLRVIDAAGNVSEDQKLYFEVTREDQPIVNMNLPYSISGGQTLNFDGEISTDPATSFSLVKINIRDQNDESLYSQTITNLSGQTTWNLLTDGQLSFVIPEDVSGKIFFRIRVADTFGNNTIFETEIIIV